MNLSLCVLIAVVIVCFMLLIVISGIRFRFNISRENFQNLNDQQFEQRQVQNVQQVVEPAESLTGANVTTDFNNVQEGNEQAENSTLFHNAECKPECCSNGRGTFSCSTGCVCVSDDHLDIITRRGGNHSSQCI